MEPIQPLFAAAVARLVRPAPLTPEKVVFAWRVAVGAAVARVTRIGLTADGTLDVVFEDDRWCAEIEQAGTAVLERIQALLGVEHVRRLQLNKKAVRGQNRRRRPAGTAHPRSHEGEAT